ncbi:MAG: Gfo/Idh/MocA family oxidoreductase [Ignavibacteria bacterium]|jgi:predicted dehydrogenase
MKIISAKKQIRLPRKGVTRLKWGVAGLGNFSEMSFIPTLQKLKKSKVVSLYSSSFERTKHLGKKFAIENKFNNFEQFLDSDIDTVYISSANADHYKQVIASANAGKNILCEKPLAVNSKQTRDIIETCKKNEVILAVNYLFRFNPLVQKAKEFINKGLLGKVFFISISFNAYIPPSDNFRFNKYQDGGGVLFDIGTHTIDLLKFFGGPFKKVSGITDNIIYKTEVEDFAAANFEFENGAYGFMSTSFIAQKPHRRIDIIGHKGNLSIENVFSRKTVPSKLTIDLIGEAKKTFMKRSDNLLYHLRALQKTFINKTVPENNLGSAAENVEIIEQILNQ